MKGKRKKSKKEILKVGRKETKGKQEEGRQGGRQKESCEEEEGRRENKGTLAGKKRQRRQNVA